MTFAKSAFVHLRILQTISNRGFRERQTYISGSVHKEILFACSTFVRVYEIHAISDSLDFAYIAELTRV
jgi:hypothetical protein